MSDLCLQRHWEESEPVAKISGKTSGRRGRERSFWPGLLAASPRHGSSADVAEAQLQPVPEIIPGFPSQGKKSSVGQPSYPEVWKRETGEEARRNCWRAAVSAPVCISYGKLCWSLVAASGGGMVSGAVCGWTVLEQMTGMRGCCRKSLICVGYGVANSD